MGVLAPLGPGDVLGAALLFRDSPATGQDFNFGERIKSPEKVRTHLRQEKARIQKN